MGYRTFALVLFRTDALMRNRIIALTHPGTTDLTNPIPRQLNVLNYGSEDHHNHRRYAGASKA